MRDVAPAFHPPAGYDIYPEQIGTNRRKSACKSSSGSPLGRAQSCCRSRARLIYSSMQRGEESDNGKADQCRKRADKMEARIHKPRRSNQGQMKYKQKKSAGLGRFEDWLDGKPGTGMSATILNREGEQPSSHPR